MRFQKLDGSKKIMYLKTYQDQLKKACRLYQNSSYSINRRVQKIKVPIYKMLTFSLETKLHDMHQWRQELRVL